MKPLQIALYSALFFLAGTTSVFSQGTKQATKAATVESVTAEIQAAPKNAALYLKRGGTWYAKGNFINAIKDYSNAITLNPKWPTPLAHRGLAYAELEKNKQAIADFSAAIRLQPTWGAPYGFRADIYDVMEQYDSALADYSKVIQLNPKSPQAHLLRGDCFSKQGADKKAIADYSAAIKLQPKWILPYSSRADSWCNLNQFQNALADYNAAIQTAPKNPSCYEERSWFLSTCKDANIRNGKQALKDALYSCKLIGWDKLDCASMDTLAAAYAEMGKFKEATDWQQKAIACSPSKNDDQYRTRLKIYQAGKSYRE